MSQTRGCAPATARARRAARALALHLTPRRLTRPLTAVVVGALLLPALGCDTDRLLTVRDPSIVEPSQLETVQALPALFGAAIGDFAVAFGGNDASEGIINWGGLLADEVGSSDTFPTRIETDQRNTQTDNANNADVFRELQRARSQADRASSAFLRLAPTDTRRSEVLSLSGFSYILLGENYCSGVPISTLSADGTTISYGQPLSTQQLFEAAVAKFDSAITAAGTSAARLNLARVGRGRALLNLGRYSDAAAAVAEVPADFVYSIDFSQNTDRQNNGVYQFNNIQSRFTFFDREGQNGLPYISAADPRVPLEDSGDVGFDGSTEWFIQNKYDDRTASIPLATGVEALLIRAEGALNGGGGDLVALLQQAHTQAGGTGTIVDPGSFDARVDLLFRERGFGLFLSGHRLGDLRRLVRPTAGAAGQPAGYGRAVNTVYPVGPYLPKSGNYGTDVNLPIPVQESGNPNFTTCDKTRA